MQDEVLLHSYAETLKVYFRNIPLSILTLEGNACWALTLDWITAHLPSGPCPLP